MIGECHWTTSLSALLVPVVAVLGLLIAYRQWRTAQNKLKFDLFERRFSVYDTARTFIRSILTSGKVSDEELFKFVSGTREAKWLLNAEISEYLWKSLYQRAVELQTLDLELADMPTGEERARNVRSQSEIKSWIMGQHDVLDEKFSEFLLLGH